MTPEDLLKAARPLDVLLPHELGTGREVEYLRLYEQQLVVVSNGRDPTEAHKLCARLTASALWGLGREASTAGALTRFQVRAPYHAGRRNLHLELNDRHSAVKKGIAHIRQVYAISDEIHERQVSAPVSDDKPALRVVGE